MLVVEVQNRLPQTMFDYKEVYSKETQQNIGKEFTRLKDVCYLDHTGSTLYSDSQLQASMEDLRRNVYGNPHSLSTSSRYTTDVIDQVRYLVLKHFNTDSNEYSVIFTSGATGALKIVAECFDWTGERLETDEDTESTDRLPGEFTYLQDNHTSVLGMRELAVGRGASIRCLSHEEAFNIFAKDERKIERDSRTSRGNSLFAYPAQCNFSGVKYPLSWILKAQNGILDESKKHSKWYCLLDAASFVSTNELDLSLAKPDFVCLSFYKMFGYPTGLGALLVKNSSADALRKVYFGGGTVMISLSAERFHIPRPILHEQFEDGTLPFLSIIAVRHGLASLTSLTGNMSQVARHTYGLARYTHHRLLTLHHGNHAPVVKIYADTSYEDFETQGNIVNLNMLRSNGEHVGYMEVLNMANLYDIQLRTGCFCNPGACQRHLQLSTQQLRTHYQAGHVCGDDKDLIKGEPTGSIRISFGYMSTLRDADRFLRMIRVCFVEGDPVNRIPDWWQTFVGMYRLKFSVQGESKTRLNVITRRLHELQIRPKENNVNVLQEILEDTPEMVLRQVKPPNHIGSLMELSDSNEETLDAIFIYPVKSCAAFSVSRWLIGPRGLRYDREWMVVTAAGVCLTQKQETRMCLVRPSVDIEKRCLVLEFSGMPSMTLPLEVTAGSDLTAVDLCQSKVCGDRVQGRDCGDAAAAWLCAALGREGLRIIRQQGCKEGRTARQMRGEQVVSKPSLSLSNQAQFLLLSTSSIAWLRDRISIDSDCDPENLVHRFRSNLVVRGAVPFAENLWRSLTIGDNCFQFEGVCTRCQMVCIDQATGEKTREPLTTLAEMFRGKMRFGAYFSHVADENETSIACGDRVVPTVVETDVAVS